MKEAIAYIRVSSQEQGRSGFGLQAQEAQLNGFAAQAGYRIVRVFREVASAKGDANLTGRPELLQALKHAKRYRRPLLITSLDRLSRESSDLEVLLDDPKLTIIDLDGFPAAGPLVLARDAGRIARVEEETKMLSERTRLGIQRAKQRGVAFGNRKNLREAQLKGADSNRMTAQKRMAELSPIIESIRSSGASSGKEIADRLNQRGLRTPRGQPWTEANLRRVLRGIRATKKQ
jgi:DNA invertase Pin-like site-specific DNA recombinase